VNDSKIGCEICGMDLVPAAELGYVKLTDLTAPVVIPASAVMITGKRSIVYVRRKDREKPSFEGVEIELGPRAGDDYIVRSGLEVGQLVVVNGSFKIDSALQLRAKPSMMSPAVKDALSDDKKENNASASKAVETPAEPAGAPQTIESAESTQTLCPIMGGAINKDVFTDYKGSRIYFCCAGCDKPFMKDPEGMISKMKAQGVILAKTPEPMKGAHGGHGR
jgi:YHS domain-containing protein